MTADIQPITPQDYPDFLEEIAVGLAARWLDRGMDVARARDLAADTVEYLRLNFGGTKLYIPRGDSYIIARRNLEILREWNGRNTNELCRRHGISEARLRQIVDAAREARRETAQAG